VDEDEHRLRLTGKLRRDVKRLAGAVGEIDRAQDVMRLHGSPPMIADGERMRSIPRRLDALGPPLRQCGIEHAHQTA